LDIIDITVSSKDINVGFVEITVEKVKLWHRVTLHILLVWAEPYIMKLNVATIYTSLSSEAL